MKKNLYKKSLYIGTAFGMLTLASPAFALPQGGAVSAGSATIQNGGITTAITQNTDRAVIDWNSFDIKSNESITFSQPTANSATLNRIHDVKPSEIMGNLTANGQVYLVNPNGMVFGKDAQVDVAGLVATTADTSNAAFMKGSRIDFNQPGTPDAAIINRGNITVKQGGLTAMVAPNVENSGIITAKAGTIALAGAETATVDFYGDGLISVATTGDEIHAQSVRNSGQMIAKDGAILMTTAEAAAVIDSVINMDGVADASSAMEEGGSIVFSGQNAHINIGAGAALSATGATKGGTIRVGGEYKGQGGTPTARSTTIEKGAKIDVSATQTGHGGEAIIWADGHTQMDGHIKATGGAQGGNGGFVETSGKQTLAVDGVVDASATNGDAGTWLLDPADLIIDGGTSNISGGPNYTPDGTVATSHLNAATINGVLQAGTSVTITTGGDAQAANGDITVTNAIDGTGGTAGADLTLSAYGSINVNNSITLNNGDLTLRSNNTGAAAGGFANVAGSITTNGGNITIGGGNGAISAGNGFATGNAGQDYGVQVNAVTVDAGGGNILINGQGYTAAAAGIDHHGVYVRNNGGIQTSGTGTINVTGIAGGTGASTDNSGVVVSFTGGVIKTTGTGSLTVTGQGGNPTGTGGQNLGVSVNIANGIQATGGGAITITGTGGNNSGGTGADNYGVNINNTCSIVSSGGSVNIIGTGGLATGGSNYGVRVSGAITGTGGAMTVTGTGGGGAGTGNVGVYVGGATAEISNAGTGSLTVTGTGGGSGASDSNIGVRVHSTGGTIKTTGTGALTVTGTGGNANGSGDFQYGVYVQTDNGIQTTGGGAITITGQGGNASGSGQSNHGIYAANSITGSGGTITMTGTGGTATGNTNYGVYINGGTALVSNSGAGDITISGTAGGSGVSDNNHGVFINSVGSGVRALGTGNITMTGVGGNSTGAGGSNHGMNVYSANGVQTIGGGSITINTTGGNNGGGGGANNYGLYVNSGSIDGSGGAVSITGTGGAANGNSNHGVYVANAGGAITNSGTGGITVVGTGGGVGASTANRGVTTNGVGGTITTSGSGDISVTGTATNSTGGIRMEVANGIHAAGTGSVSLTTDSVVFSVANAVNSAHNLTIAPKTPGAGLGIGTGAGTLTLTDTQLGRINWGTGYTLTLGSSTTGDIDINSAYNFTNPVIFQSGTAKDITLNGALTASYNTGTALTLASGGNFINNVGAAPFTMAGSARWLVYSENPALDTLNGLTANFTQYGCTYGSCVPLAPNTTTGNGFLYRYAPVGVGLPPPPLTLPSPDITEAPPVIPAPPPTVSVTTPPTSETPQTPEVASTEEIPVPQFLLNAILPSTYTHPAAATADMIASYNTRSYGNGAPTPGLDVSDSTNIDAQHTEATRSGYPLSTVGEFGTYRYDSDMLRLLGCADGASCTNID